MRVREKISDKFVTYPNKKLVPLIGHVGEEQYYEIVEEERPIYDYRTHRIERVETYTVAIGELLPIWRVTYELHKLSNEDIQANVEQVLGDYLDKVYPLWERIKHTSIGSESMLAMIQGLEYDADKLAYVQGQLDWVTLCREEAKDQITALYVDGILPTFNFTERP